MPVYVWSKWVWPYEFSSGCGLVSVFLTHDVFAAGHTGSLAGPLAMEESEGSKVPSAFPWGQILQVQGTCMCM